MRILLVEDDNKIASYLKDNLETKGQVVDWVTNGKNGFLKAVSNSYTLIILDISVPEMSGYEFCREFRERNKKTPILVISAQHETSSKIKLLDSGADDYITKPFHIEEVFSRISAILRRYSREDEDMNKKITISDLVIDLDRRKVKRANINVDLSKKEFDLLLYMAENKGKVLSRASILENVWENHLDLLPSTVDVHICWLRDKLHKANKTPLLHTERGVGYILDDEIA